MIFTLVNSSRFQNACSVPEAVFMTEEPIPVLTRKFVETDPLIGDRDRRKIS